MVAGPDHPTRASHLIRPHRIGRRRRPDLDYAH
jgi:hypothetical protein